MTSVLLCPCYPILVTHPWHFAILWEKCSTPIQKHNLLSICCFSDYFLLYLVVDVWWICCCAMLFAYLIVDWKVHFFLNNQTLTVTFRELTYFCSSWCYLLSCGISNKLWNPPGTGVYILRSHDTLLTYIRTDSVQPRQQIHGVNTYSITTFNDFRFFSMIRVVRISLTLLPL